MTKIKLLIVLIVAIAPLLGVFHFAPVQKIHAACACDMDGKPGWTCVSNCIGIPPNQNCGNCSVSRCADATGCGGGGPPPPPPPPPPVCGDGSVNQSWEQCDAGGGNSNAPNAVCRKAPPGSLACKLQTCGDGIVDDAPTRATKPEECDDGNLVDTDTCNNICEFTAVGKPWISSTDGNMYALGGYNGFSIYNVSTLNPPISIAAYNFDYNRPVFLTRYLLGAGPGGGFPGNQYLSENNYLVQNYTDLAVKPPLFLGKNVTWYQIIKSIALKYGNLTAITQATLNAATSGNLMAKALPGAAANTPFMGERTGDLTITTGFTCNLQALILVSGNLTIDPDFKIDTAANGCMFVVGGNITTTLGTRKNAATVLSQKPTNYDMLEAALITDGTFATQKDTFPTGKKGDGLYIRGLVIADKVDLQRDIKGYSNTSQPSEVFVYDSRYQGSAVFNKFLDFRRFSIREI